MDQDHFWLSEAQFARLEPYLPTDTRGKPRVDDRRVISGIVHVLISGGRWKDAPAAYGPRKTLYNRFRRWAAKDVWSNIFYALAATGGPPAVLLIDSSAVRAHRCASGGKGGAKPGHWTLARRPHHQNPCTERCALPPRRVLADRRPGGGLHRRRQAARCDHTNQAGACRQRLRQQGRAAKDRGHGCGPRTFHPNATGSGKIAIRPYSIVTRNAIERMFGRLKDFRRVATRYDKLAETFHATVCIAAIVSYWL